LPKEPRKSWRRLIGLALMRSGYWLAERGLSMVERDRN